MPISQHTNAWSNLHTIKMIWDWTYYLIVPVVCKVTILIGSFPIVFIVVRALMSIDSAPRRILNTIIFVSSAIIFTLSTAKVRVHIIIFLQEAKLEAQNTNQMKLICA